MGQVGYNHLISNKHEWNNCSIENAHKIPNKCHRGALTVIIFLVIFAGTALHFVKLENLDPTFSSDNPYPSLPSVDTDNMK